MPSDERARPAVERLAPPARVEKRATALGHVTGIAVAVAGVGMLVAAGVDLAEGSGRPLGLALPGVAATATGLVLWRATVPPSVLPFRVVFSTVAGAWVAVSLVGALPYLTTAAIGNPADALFESVSGFTTTGATLIAGLDEQSAGLLFWRAFTQWMGGLGVIVLAVAVLPYLGSGGMTLLRSEVPGPSSERLAPRVRDTARRLWGLYVGFTVVMTAAYLGGGMSPFDATAHAFTTVSTGGFSTRDGSLGAFGSPVLEWAAVGGMLVAGMNFVLLYRAVRGRSGLLLRSVEARAYVLLLVSGSLAVAAWNTGTGTWSHETIRTSVFSVVSVGSTTGFTNADFGAWGHQIQAVLLFLMLVGAMSGSTGGGSKVFRLLAAISYARREVARHVRPNLVAVVRLGRETVPEEVVARILGYHALFLGLVAISVVAVAAFEVDVVTAISAVIASVSNVGPGLGDVGPTGGFAALPDGARYLTMVVMLLGRLEIYPLLLGALSMVERIPSPAPRRQADRSDATGD